ncbi:hypothetical protein EMGBS15_08680 [Filimonas sp.]|nr:hypothetical protein EMGBS15_08680 [Filimonas sp.]
MKRIIITALATLLVFTAVLFNGCKHDKCEQVSCAFGGVCKEGNCLCQTGYEGEHCETITRDKFKGQWNVNEDGTLSSPAQFTASIENGPMINQVVIKNFQNFYMSENVLAVAYKDTLTIPLQVMSDGSKIEGWATITDTNPLNQHYYQHAVMTMYYKVTSSDGLQVNQYGYGGSGPSLWAK